MIHFLFFVIIPTDLLVAFPMGMFTVKPSTNHSHRSVQALRSAMKLILPSKKDQQSLFIECILNRDRTGCKELHQKKDKKVFYQFNDQSSENSEQLPIHAVNSSILLNLRENAMNNHRFRNDTFNRGYQWLLNDDIMEDPSDALSWESKDSTFEPNDDDDDDDLYASHQKSTYLPRIIKTT